MSRIGRGFPATSYVFATHTLQTVRNVSDGDTGSAAEASSISAHTSAADTGTGVDNAGHVTAHLAAADTVTTTETTSIVAQQPTDDEANAAAESVALVAHISSADTGNGVETDSSPPSHLSAADTGSSTDAVTNIKLSAADTAVGAEGSVYVGIDEDEDAAFTDGGEDIDDTGGSSKHASDVASQAVEEASIVATLSTFQNMSSSENAVIYISDGEFIFATERFVKNEFDTVASTSSQSVTAYLSASDTGSGAEGSPVRIEITNGGALLNENFSGIEDLPVINLADADTAAIAGTDTQRIGVRLADTGHAVDASSLVNHPTASDTISHAEVAQTPDVNLPTGIEVVSTVEASPSILVHLSSAETAHIVDDEATDRGTPLARQFIVPIELRTVKVLNRRALPYIVYTVAAEVRLQTVKADNRVYLVAAESRTFMPPEA